MDSQPCALTVAIIARDEEASLPRLFASLKPLSGLAAQIVVVDTGSRDATRALAASLGAEVHAFDWRDDFAAARNHALSLARGEWILSMDADDVLPGETAQWLQGRLAEGEARAFAFRVQSPGPDGSVSECSQIRLVPNRRGLSWRNPIHETLGDSVLEAGLETILSGMPILHEGYRDPVAVARKRRRNLLLLEKAVTSESPSPSLLLAWARMHMAMESYAVAEAALRRILEGNGAALSATGGVRAASPTSLGLSARIHLGQCQLYAGRKIEALQTFRGAPAIAAHDAQFLLEYGKALWLNGRSREAREAWQQAVDRGPGQGPVPTDWPAVLSGAKTLLERTAGPETAVPSADWTPVADLTPTAGKTPFPLSALQQGAASRSEADKAPVTQRKPADPDAPPAPGNRGGRRLDLSVCSILKDEIQNLPDLVSCIPLSRLEWVAVDTGSRDGTLEVLRKLDAKVHTWAWNDDFAAARNESLRHATRGWILWLDADDRVDEAFWDKVESLLDGPRRAYRFIVRSPRENAAGESFRQIRLFPNGQGLAFEGRIHEQLGTSLRKLGLEASEAEIEIRHLGYDTPGKREAKLRRNHALLEKERAAHPHDPAVAMEYGNCLYQKGDYRGAKDVYLSMLPAGDPARCGAAPADEILRHFPALLGETSEKLSDPAGAEAWFRLSAAWNPTNLQPRYWLGKRALARGDLRGALDAFLGLLDQPVVVGKVAGDNQTVRRNALGVATLLEMQLFGAAKAPHARAYVEELIAGGLEDFPVEHRVPFDFFRDAGDLAALTDYARKYLEVFPSDVAFWEDFLEKVFASGKHAELLALYASRPSMGLCSGPVEAFRARSLEEAGSAPEAVYPVYLAALRKFPEDPTLLVYFSEFVNHNRLYVRCYADLKSLADPPDTVRDFLRQLEAQGLGGAAAER